MEYIKLFEEFVNEYGGHYISPQDVRDIRKHGEKFVMKDTSIIYAIEEPIGGATSLPFRELAFYDLSDPRNPKKLAWQYFGFKLNPSERKELERWKNNLEVGRSRIS